MRYKTVKFSNLEVDNLLQEVKDGDIEVTVTEDDIDSGEATSGQVLAANGEGGAEFTDPITYESKPAASGGTDVSLVTTGEKYNWDNKQDAITRDQPVNLAMVVGLDSQDNVVTGEVRAVNIDSGNASSGQVLTADGSGNAAWQTPSSGGMSNPMSAAGDIIVGGANGTPTRLAMGSAGQVLKVNAAGTGLEYGAGGGGGGAQLYLHTMIISSYTICFISNSSTPVSIVGGIRNYTIIPAAFRNDYTCSLIGYDVELITPMEQNFYLYFYYKNGFSSTMFSNSTVVTDTVTAL